MDLVEGLINAIRTKTKTTDNTREAIVEYVDNEGIVWVRLPGAEKASPTVTTSDEIKPGDTVTVEWRNNQLHITANTSNPSISANAKEFSETNKKVKKATKLAAVASTAASEAKKVASAINQHFWDDDKGAHVTEIEKDDYLAMQELGFPDWQPDPSEPNYKPYYSVLLNTLGQIFLSAKSYLASFTHSAIAFYDGVWDGIGDGARHIIAAFGKDGAQIGAQDNTHLSMNFNSLRLVSKEGEIIARMADLRGADGWSDFIQEEKKVLDYRETGAPDWKLAVKPTFQPFKNISAYDKEGNIIEGAVEGDLYLLPAAEWQQTVYITYKSACPGISSFDFGVRNKNDPIGVISVAEGDNCSATGTFSHAEGYSSVAWGVFSHAEGRETLAIEEAAHAEGYITTAEGTGAHAEGRKTYAGYAAHAEGSGSYATGAISHAEGSQCHASGDYSHAQNRGTIASSKGQTALGQFNVEDAQGVYVAIIGNGTNDNNRSNALAVKWDGTVVNGSDVPCMMQYRGRATGDFNDLETPGIYYTQNGMTANKPTTANLYAYIEVFSFDEGMYAQTVWGNNGAWRRVKAGNPIAWGAWTAI